MSELGLTLVGLAIVVGLIGVVVPVLPGGLLVWAAIGIWAIAERDPLGWAVLAVATLAVGLTQILKYTVPVRRLQDAELPRASILVGVAAAIAGFFLVPVIGLFIGFVVGIYVCELLRLGSHDRAWPSTRQALRSVGLSILIELAGALVATGAWLAAVVAA